MGPWSTQIDTCSTDLRSGDDKVQSIWFMSFSYSSNHSVTHHALWMGALSFRKTPYHRYRNVHHRLLKDLLWFFPLRGLVEPKSCQNAPIYSGFILNESPIIRLKWWNFTFCDVEIQAKQEWQRLILHWSFNEMHSNVLVFWLTNQPASRLASSQTNQLISQLTNQPTKKRVWKHNLLGRGNFNKWQLYSVMNLM